MSSKKDFIINQLERVFNGPVWYGPTMMETINQLTDERASNHYKDGNSIIQLIGHITSWRKFVSEHLNGNDTYEVTEEANFPTLKFSEAVQQLKDSQTHLIEAIKRFPEEKLSNKVPTREYTFQFMLNGIVQHDLYHLGQIVLLKR